MVSSFYKPFYIGTRKFLISTDFRHLIGTFAISVIICQFYIVVWHGSTTQEQVNKERGDAVLRFQPPTYNKSPIDYSRRLVLYEKNQSNSLPCEPTLYPIKDWQDWEELNHEQVKEINEKLANDNNNRVSCQTRRPIFDPALIINSIQANVNFMTEKVTLSSPPNALIDKVYSNLEEDFFYTLPLFYIAGEQKCGTTFLRALLVQHPKLVSSYGLYGKFEGETHFFDHRIYKEDEINSTNIDYFSGLYAAYNPVRFGKFTEVKHNINKIEKATSMKMEMLVERSNFYSKQIFTFDTSPSYFTWPQLPQLVTQIVPDLKVILLIRDPVKRYESAIRMTLCNPHADIQSHLSFHFHLHTDLNNDGNPSAPSNFRVKKSNLTMVEESNTDQLISLRNSSKSTEEYRGRQMQAFLDKNRKRPSGNINLAHGMYYYNIKRWLKVIPRENLLVIDSSELFKYPSEIYKKVIVWLDMDDFGKTTKGSSNLSKHVPLPNLRKALLKGKNESPCKSTYYLSKDEEALLASFYKSHNDDLEDYLGYPLKWNLKYNI